MNLSFGTLPSAVSADSPSTATLTILDDDRTVRFSSSSYTVNEGSNRTITVRLNGSSSQNLTIPIVVTPGTDRSVTINSGSTSGTVSIPTRQDTDCDDETLILSFGRLPSGVSAGDTSTATVTINDDDTCAITIIGNRGPFHAEGSTDDVATYTSDPSDVSWSLAGDDADFFEIRSNGGLRFIEAPDFDNPQDEGNNNIYDVTITATKSGYDDGTLEVDVRVTNESPTIDSGPDLVTFREGGTGSVGTYSASDPGGGRITWSLPNTTFETDRGVFNISSGGLLTFDDITPDYEDPDDHNDDNVYRITVTASDASNRLDTINVTITVRNVDEMGTVNLSTTTPQVSANITAVLTDEDGNVRNESWQWQSSPNGVSWSNISGATGYSYRPVRGDAGNRLRARVTYDDGHGTGKTATSGATSAVTQSNTPPTFDDGATATREVPENTGSGTNIGSPVSASDSDVGDTLTYTLGGTNANSFEIVDTSGQLQTKTGVTYDHETKASYSVTVSVSDGNGGSDSISVTINVTNENESPELDLPIGDRTMTVGESTPVVLSGRFSDPDGDTLTYTALSSNTGVVTASVSGSTLTLTAVAAGSATITVTVADRSSVHVVRLAAEDVIEVTVELPPLDKVTDLEGEPGMIRGTIDLDWEPADGATSYVVEQWRQSLVPGVYHYVTLSDSEVMIDVAETKAVVTGLEGGETYRHRVVGVQDVGGNRIHGPESDPVDTTLPLPDKVRKPTGSSGMGHGQIALSWSAADGATGYEVRQKKRLPLRPDTWIELPGEGFEITFTGTTAVISNLDPDETYVYQVRGTGVHGDGEWSNESDEIAVHDERPTQPEDLRGGPMVGGRGIELRWLPAAGAGGYDVEVSPRESTQQINRSTVTGYVMTGVTATYEVAEIIGVIPFTDYTLTVRAWKLYDGSRLYSVPSEIEREAPRPSFWEGHQADHNVKYATSMLGNSIIENSIAPSAGAWNAAMGSLGKGLKICPASERTCIDNFTVIVTDVDNNNDSIGERSTDPTEGCGTSRACVKPVVDELSDRTEQFGSHFGTLYIVFEDPPWRAAEEVLHGKKTGKWIREEYMWTDNRNVENDPVTSIIDRPVKYVYVGRVMIHEFGHTLGQPDFYNDTTGLADLDAIMNRHETMTGEDIEQLKAIYLLHSSH